MGNKTTEEEEGGVGRSEETETKRWKTRIHRENDKRHLFRDARVAIGEKRETRKKKKRKEIIHIYIYVYILSTLLSQKRCKIGPNIKMNGLSYSHESKQKVCGTYLSCESSIRVLSSSHPHVAMSYPKPNSSSHFIFGLFFSVRAMSYVLFLYGSMWLFSSHEFYKKK